MHTLGDIPRRRLLELVMLHPGSTPSGIARTLDLSRSAVLYHTRILERAGALVAIPGRSGVLLFPNGGVPRWAKCERQRFVWGSQARRAVYEMVRGCPDGIPREAITKALAHIPERTRNHAIAALLRRNMIAERVGRGSRWLQPIGDFA